MSRHAPFAVLLVIAVAPMAQAGSTEQREYSVLLNGKDAGHSTLIIVQEDDGRVHIRGTVTVKAQQLLVIPYSFTMETDEWWQAGKLVKLTALTVENGKKTEVNAQSQGDKLVVGVNSQYRAVSGDVWPTSFWKLADRRFQNNVVPILESDTGKDMAGRLEYVGTEKMNIGGRPEDCFRFRVTGIPSPTDLWFDQYHRLVRQEFTENGQRTIVHLVSRKN